MIRSSAVTASVLLSILSIACSRANEPAAQSPAASRTIQKKAAKVELPVSVSETAPARRVGDFAVHMISGSFRKNPALLTERVTGNEYGAWVIEYRLEDSEGSRALRVWMNEDSGQVTRVVHLLDGAEKPGTVADFDALMASASVVPDTNEGLVANSTGTCTLGPQELDCETKNYRVRIGEREASLGVTQSAAVPGMDISGEITAADGSVIYRSELIERGNEAETTNDSFALR